MRGVRALLLVFLVCIGGAEGASAASGDEARAALVRLADAGDGFPVEASLTSPSHELPLGAPISWRVSTGRDASLLLLHVDAHGVGTLLTPNGLGAAPRVTAGEPLTWPAEDAGFSLAAEPPIGRESLLVVATTEPIEAATLGLEFGEGAFAIVEAADVAVLVARIREALASRPAEAWSTTLVEQRVLAREEGPEVLAEEMVAYFVTRSRAIKRPRLDLHVHFAVGSAELDVAATRSLDQVALALADRRLDRARFRVAGHTDSMGEHAFNESLSESRAGAVIRYLVETRGLDPERIELAHYGERRPIEPNDTPEGRRMNRRVEFELIRDT